MFCCVNFGSNNNSFEDLCLHAINEKAAVFFNHVSIRIHSCRLLEAKTLDSDFSAVKCGWVWIFLKNNVLIQTEGI